MHDDCYFYLYSECKLKERCRYRHNPLSKDNLILCKIWSKNKKCRMDCPLRHSLYHVVKQRSDTMCYWEDKGGCTKYRCEFRHVDSKKDEWKEPKIKLLTEIIESKNIHNTVGNDLDVSSEVTVNINDNNIYTEKSGGNYGEDIDFTVSSANCILAEEKKINLESSCNKQKSFNKDVIEKKQSQNIVVVNEEIPYQVKEILVNSSNHFFDKKYIDESTNVGFVEESVNSNSDTLKVDSNTFKVNQSVFSHKQDNLEECFVNNKRELIISDDLPSKKNKSDSKTLDLDIDSLDKEIAELEKLLHDS